MKLSLKLIGGSVGLVVGLCLGNQTMGKSPDGHVAPLNPEFVSYLEMKARKPLRDEWQPGLIPAPVDPTVLGGRRHPIQRDKAGLPAYYDLRATGRLSPVKNQLPYGTCWAHATMGALESRLLPAQTWDFSENNLANLHGFDFDFNDGGGNLISIACLARWTGPVTENEDPYPNPDHSPVDLPPCLHLQEAFFVSSRHSELDNDDLKQAVIDYGGVYVGMFWADDAYNDTYKSYYYTGTNNNNHAVVMVGWDDNFPAQNFTTPAAGNGAFIIKNSFGTNWADHGYFYASYYDLKMAPGGCTVFGAEPATNYSDVYQYDPFGWVTSVRYTEETWGANIFTATSACPLWAVSFYTPEYGADYEIRIYRYVTENQPSSGVLALQQTGTLTHQGYYTVRLNTPVGLAVGERFSVVLSFPGTTATYPIRIEYACPNYSSAATTSPGQSFFGPDGENWEDLTEYVASGNVCLKAFTGWPVRCNLDDFDGDGLADFVVMDSGGNWYLWFSRNGYTRGGPYALGVAGLPSAGDYDGDGLADPAVMDAGGNWYLWFSRNGYARGGPYALGVAGLPSAGDYDGDGLADPAVMDAGGNWYLWFSGNGYVRSGPYALGVIGTPSVGDYDGDCLTDPAVMDSGGNWYLWFSGNGYVRGGPYALGVTGTPRAGDYDGDGLADPAVMDGSNWYLWLSGGGYERSGPYILDTDAETYETVQESLAVTSGGNIYNFTVYRPNVYRSFPGVLVLNGLNPQQLASKGYYVVSGEPESSEIAIDVMKAMKAHERCSDKVGATGYSWGGAFVLALAAQGKNLSAVFEIAGLLVPENNIDLSVDIPNPVYFVTGENDELAPPDSVRDMYEEFLKSGQPAEIYIIPGAGHGYSTAIWDDLLNRAAEFFDLYLQ